MSVTVSAMLYCERRQRTLHSNNKRQDEYLIVGHMELLLQPRNPCIPNIRSILWHRKHRVDDEYHEDFLTGSASRDRVFAVKVSELTREERKYIIVTTGSTSKSNLVHNLAVAAPERPSW